MTPLSNTVRTNSERENLAAHKFHQKRIMGKAARRNLVVQYFQWKWTFLDSATGQKYFSSPLVDVEAIVWLDNFHRLEVVSGTTA
jgi:hypothetical protein